MNERDLEERLRDELQAEAGRMRPSPDAWARVRARIGRPSRTNRMRLAFGVAAALFAGLATAAVILAPSLLDGQNPGGQGESAHVIARPHPTGQQVPPTPAKSPSVSPSESPAASSEANPRATTLAEVSVERELRVQLSRAEGVVTVRAYRWREQRWNPLDGNPTVGPKSPSLGGVCELRVTKGERPAVHVRLNPANTTGCSKAYVFDVDGSRVSRRSGGS